MRNLTHTAPKSGYLPTLDGWRAIAIFLVLCTHSKHWPHALDPLRLPLQAYGYLGVDLFFALSGLLICHRLLEEERVRGAISLTGFYVRRSFRIFPPAVVYLGVIAVLGLVRVLPTEWLTWWSALLYVRNYAGALIGDNPQNGYTAHLWSLSVEEHFYLLLPAVLVFVPRYRKQVLLVATALAFVWIAVYLHHVPLAQRSFFWYRRTDLHMASLLFPAWLTLVLAKDSARQRLRRLLHPAVLPVCLLLLLGAKYMDKRLHPGLTTVQRIQRYDPLPALNAAAILPPEPGAIRPVEHWPMLLGNPATVLTFAIPLLAPFLVLSTLLHPGSPLSRLLETAPFRFAGRLSYSLYLWQQLFWAMNSSGWPIARVQFPAWLGLLLTCGAAAASFYLLERPFVRLGHRLAPPVTPGHKDTAVAMQKPLS